MTCQPACTARGYKRETLRTGTVNDFKITCALLAGLYELHEMVLHDVDVQRDDAEDRLSKAKQGCIKLLDKFLENKKPSRQLSRVLTQNWKEGKGGAGVSQKVRLEGVGERPLRT